MLKSIIEYFKHDKPHRPRVLSNFQKVAVCNDCGWADINAGHLGAEKYYICPKCGGNFGYYVGRYVFVNETNPHGPTRLRFIKFYSRSEKPNPEDYDECCNP